MSHPLETIVARAKRRWFVYPGSDIYGGLANAWDYGPYGVQLKKNIQDLRWKTFVQQRDDMIGLDAQILMHPRTWEASGHVGNFNDPMIDDKKTGERFRADKLIEDKIATIMKQAGEAGTLQAIGKVYGVNNLVPESWTFEQMQAFIAAEVPNNPNNGKKADWTEVRKFNMMFYTYQGVISNEENKVWLRPETAQGIFVNFKNVMDTTRMRIPFGIAQIGKAFRNEITPGNFLFRTREFEQMEIEYFVENDTDKAMEKFNEWKDQSQDFWYNKVGLNKEKLKFRDQDPDELAHYAKATTDVEYQFPRGWGELQWLAYRTDFDLKQHQEFSKKDMQYHDPHTGKRYVPHVIEPSFGLSRTVLATMLDAYEEETYTDANGNESTRVVARFHKNVAPIKFCIIPLVKKNEEMVKIAKDLYKKLAQDYMCEYDDSGNIGKCYRRQDEIGTPYCVTIDHQTLDDGTVTVRERDSMGQERVKIEEVIL